MKNFSKLILAISLFYSFTLVTNASDINGTIDPANQYAWGENIGWILMTNDIHITDSQLTGHAWGENTGWISLNCDNDNSCGLVNYKVANDDEGNLSGYAWGENTGWIDFNPNFGGVKINNQGIFEGYAWGENIGWINFNCNNDSSCGVTDFKVSTDWRPKSTRSNGSGGGGGSGSGSGSSSSHSGGSGPSSLIVMDDQKNNEIPKEEENNQDKKEPQNTEKNTCQQSEMSEVPFKDIKGHSAEDAINYLFKNCIVSGKTFDTFAPDDFATRAEVLKIALKSNNFPLENYQDLFLDVKSSDWFSGFIMSGLKNKIIQGYENKTFKPNQFITRAEALKIIFEAKGGEFLNGGNGIFSDANSNDWFYKYITLAFSKGLISSFPGQLLKPNQFITRGEVAKIVYTIEK